MPHWDAIVLQITTQTVGFGARARIFRLGWPGRLCACNSNREQACGQWLISTRESTIIIILSIVVFQLMPINIHYSPLRKQQLFCTLSIIERGLEPILWSDVDRWSLRLGVRERLVSPAVLVTCLLSGPFLNGLCTSYYIGIDWNASMVDSGHNEPVGLFHKPRITSLQGQVTRNQQENIWLAQTLEGDSAFK